MEGSARAGARKARRRGGGPRGRTRRLRAGGRLRRRGGGLGPGSAAGGGPARRADGARGRGCGAPGRPSAMSRVDRPDGIAGAILGLAGAPLGVSDLVDHRAQPLLALGLLLLELGEALGALRLGLRLLRRGARSPRGGVRASSIAALGALLLVGELSLGLARSRPGSPLALLARLELVLASAQLRHDRRLLGLPRRSRGRSRSSARTRVLDPRCSARTWFSSTSRMRRSASAITRCSSALIRASSSRRSASSSRAAAASASADSRTKRSLSGCGRRRSRAVPASRTPGWEAATARASGAAPLPRAGWRAGAAAGSARGLRLLRLVGARVRSRGRARDRGGTGRRGARLERRDAAVAAAWERGRRRRGRARRLRLTGSGLARDRRCGCGACGLRLAAALALGLLARPLLLARGALLLALALLALACDLTLLLLVLASAASSRASSPARAFAARARRGGATSSTASAAGLPGARRRAAWRPEAGPSSGRRPAGQPSGPLRPRPQAAGRGRPARAAAPAPGGVRSRGGRWRRRGCLRLLAAAWPALMARFCSAMRWRSARFCASPARASPSRARGESFRFGARGRRVPGVRQRPAGLRARRRSARAARARREPPRPASAPAPAAGSGAARPPSGCAGRRLRRGGRPAARPGGGPRAPAAAPAAGCLPGAAGAGWPAASRGGLACCLLLRSSLNERIGPNRRMQADPAAMPGASRCNASDLRGHRISCLLLALDLAADVAVADLAPAVALLLAARQRQLDLGARALEVDPRRARASGPCAARRPDQALDLVAVQQQLARALGIVVLVRAPARRAGCGRCAARPRPRRSPRRRRRAGPCPRAAP